MADTDTFDNRFSAATDENKRLSDDDIDYLFGRPRPGATPPGPVKNPAGDIVHPSIPGIHSVETSGGQEGFPSGLWSGAANAVQGWQAPDWWKRATTPYKVPPMPDVSGPGDILRDLTTGRDNPVEKAFPTPDKGHLSSPPTRTDGPPGADMPVPAPAPAPFGAGATPPVGGVAGGLTPGGPTFPTFQRPPLPAPTPAPQPAEAAPPPAAAQPSPAPAGPSPGAVGATPGGSPQVPPKDTSLLPPGSLADIFHKWNSWRDENRLMLLAMAGGLAGSQSIGQGLGRAFSAAVPAAQADMARGNANATADLLMQKLPGLSHDQAVAMARNPEIMKQVIPQLYGANRQHVTVKDSLGNDVPMSFDPHTGKYYTATGEEVGGTGQGGTGTGLGDLAHMPIRISPETGRDESFMDAFKKADPVGYSTVQQLLSGDISAKGRNMQKYMPYAARAEPGFSEATFDSRSRTIKDFDPQGINGKNLTALNTALNHIDHLDKLSDQLGNTRFPTMNALWNWMKVEGGNEQYQGIRSQYEAAVNGVSGEMAKVFRSQGMAERDIDEWRKSFSADSSPAQIKGAVKSAMDLLTGRLDAIGQAWNTGMRVSTTKPAPDFLSPPARKIYDRLREGSNIEATPSPATSHTVPPPEERRKDVVYMTPKGPMIWRGNGWEPAR